jgi:hypothetical protein
MKITVSEQVTIIEFIKGVHFGFTLKCQTLEMFFMHDENDYPCMIIGGL